MGGDLGGTLRVESELGKGSIFFAIIPTHHASKATTLPPVLEEGYV
jgi:hypothetical protein